MNQDGHESRVSLSDALAAGGIEAALSACVLPRNRSVPTQTPKVALSVAAALWLLSVFGDCTQVYVCNTKEAARKWCSDIVCHKCQSTKNLQTHCWYKSAAASSS